MDNWRMVLVSLEDVVRKEMEELIEWYKKSWKNEMK